MVGFVCISKASLEAFGTSFFTILRTTRNPELDRLVPPAETSSAEPLSKELSAVKLRLFQGKKPLLLGPDNMQGGVDIETISGHGSSCFIVPKDAHDLDSAASLKITRNSRSSAFKIDVDSLLMPDGL